MPCSESPVRARVRNVKVADHPHFHLGLAHADGLHQHYARSPRPTRTMVCGSAFVTLFRERARRVRGARWRSIHRHRPIRSYAADRTTVRVDDGSTASTVDLVAPRSGCIPRA